MIFGYDVFETVGVVLTTMLDSMITVINNERSSTCPLTASITGDVKTNQNPEVLYDVQNSSISNNTLNGDYQSDNEIYDIEVDVFISGIDGNTNKYIEIYIEAIRRIFDNQTYNNISFLTIETARDNLYNPTGLVEKVGGVKIKAVI